MLTETAKRLAEVGGSGSMGSQAYNTYPNTIYTGAKDPGTIYR